MSTTLSLRCRCGAVRGIATDVTPRAVSHVVCYCDDCRAFARWLGQDGLLDAHGGTDIVQLAPRALRITEGAEHLRCMRLSDRGMFRFYTECCRTPFGNTISAKVPFVGMPSACMAEALEAAGAPREAIVGPARGIQARFALGGMPANADRTAGVGVIWRISSRLFRWWRRGEGHPSPHFDDATGAPRWPVQVLTPDERAALRDAEQRSA